MAMDIESKHAVVSKSPAELYMAFTDMRNFVQFLPEDKKDSVQADFDSISATVQGFNLGVRVNDRSPYSSINFKDSVSPAIIKPLKGDKYTYLILPIRMN